MNITYSIEDESLGTAGPLSLIDDLDENVSSYMFEGYWMDIGRYEDYSKVLEKFESVKGELL